jgi:hypothetical protein
MLGQPHHVAGLHSQRWCTPPSASRLNRTGRRVGSDRCGPGQRRDPRRRDHRRGLGDIVLLAIGLGALATRLASTDVAFAVVLSVTTAARLIGDLAAGPVLHRLVRNQRPDDIMAADPQGRSTADGDVAPGE